MACQVFECLDFYTAITTTYGFAVWTQLARQFDIKLISGFSEVVLTRLWQRARLTGIRRQTEELPESDIGQASLGVADQFD